MSQPRGGTGWGWPEEPHALWIYWFALLNSREGRGLKAAPWPLCRGWHSCRWELDQLWAPNQGGCWSNPSEQEPGQEPFTNPFPLMLLQIKVPLGRNNCSAKDKLRFFLGCQTILQFSQLSFQALRPVPWQRGRPAPRFYCHKVIVPFWSFFLVVFFFVTLITTTRALTEPIKEYLTALWGYSSLCPSVTMWMVQLLPRQLTLLQSHSGQPPVAHLGEFILNIDFAKPEWDYFCICMSWLWTMHGVVHFSKTLEASLLSLSFTDLHEEKTLKAYLGVLPQFHSYWYPE